MLARASLLTLVVITSLGTTRGAEPGSGGKVSEAEGIAFFEKKIRPVLVEHCYRCHSAEAEKVRAGLLLDTRQAVHEGGDTGPAVAPFKPKDSLLIDALEYKTFQMPPGKKLPGAVVADFRKWVEMGAPDPRDGKVVTSKPTVTPAGELWSLRPVRPPKPRAIKTEGWARNAIDQFLLAALEARGLKPVADASPEALLRRVHFDLVGLPPSPRDVEAFLKDPSPEAFAAVVDRLLASPQFGERWGRHWLDVARYAESNGKDRDALYPHAWRYRNYVLDAFNRDKPYDQFVREQVAGDLLPAGSEDEKEEHLVATGFLALGPKPFTQRGERFTMDLIDDQIDTTTRAFLALTVSCARCHDHKFDPIPTRDYYSLASIFHSTRTYFNRQAPNTARDLLVLDAKGDAPAKPAPKQLTPQGQRIQKQIEAVEAEIAVLKKTPGADKKAKLQQARRRLKQLQNRLASAGSPAPGGKRLAMGAGEGTPTDLAVFIRGEVGKRGEPAPRGFLSAISLSRSIPIDPKGSGRRELAEWLADPSNPLTARVAVNRVWHHLFGRGLVRTVDNFGSNGEKPSHPELLDHLATQFMQEGWSHKKLIRSIVLSRTYQLASVHDEANFEVDPDNTLLWRRSLRRLDAEAIRDALLSASGQLKLERPEQSVVARIGYGEVGRGINTAPLEEEFPHRSVYLPILRTQVPEILKVFDFAEPSLVVGERSVTTVPSQALYLMNNPFVLARAEGLAGQLLKEEAARRIDRAYLICFGRLPAEPERQHARDFLARCEGKLRSATPDPSARDRRVWTTYCQALLASAEFRYVR